MYPLGTILHAKSGKINDTPENRLDVVGVVIAGPFTKDDDDGWIPNKFYKVSWTDGKIMTYQESDLVRFIVDEQDPPF